MLVKMLYRDVLEYTTKPNGRHDITKDVQQIIKRYEISDGLCNIFVKGTTAGLMINEDDRMLMADVEKLLSQLAPEDKLYQRPANAHSHLRSIMLSSNLSVPIAAGKLLLGRWQSILLWEFDVEERKRMIVVTVVGG